MYKRHGPAHTAPAIRPGVHQHPVGENSGTAPQRGADQGHLTCPAPPNNTPTEPRQIACGRPLAQGCSTPTQAATRRGTMNQLTLRVNVDGCRSTSFMLGEIHVHVLFGSHQPSDNNTGHLFSSTMFLPAIWSSTQSVNPLLPSLERFETLQPEVWACVRHVGWQNRELYPLQWDTEPFRQFE